MQKFYCLVPLVFCVVSSTPTVRIMTPQAPAQLLTLPSNATSIRANIEDSFSCEGREYGYYADVENECQLFHICLPVTYSTGRQQTFRWSFICPDETVFNQEMFTCVRSDESSIDCADSPRYYELNRSFGDVLEADQTMEEQPSQEAQMATSASDGLQVIEDLLEDRANRRSSKY